MGSVVIGAASGIIARVSKSEMAARQAAVRS